MANHRITRDTAQRGQEFVEGGAETLAQEFVTATAEDLGKAAQLEPASVKADETLAGGAYLMRREDGAVWVNAAGRPLTAAEVDAAREIHSNRQAAAQEQDASETEARLAALESQIPAIVRGATARRTNRKTDAGAD